MNDDLVEAARFFELKNNSSLNDINKQYRELLFKWHPDHFEGDSEDGRLMTMKIISSYKILMEYCYNYKFSFLKEDLEKAPLVDDPEEFWNKKFGHDPLWGYMK